MVAATVIVAMTATVIVTLMAPEGSRLAARLRNPYRAKKVAVSGTPTPARLT